MKRILARLTILLALIGIGFVCYPFIASLKPSEKILTENPEVIIDLSTIQEGEAKRVKWNNLPVIVLHRTKAQIAQISELNGYRANDQLLTSVPEPKGLIAKYRSIKPEYFVVYGWTGNAIQCGSNYTSVLSNHPAIKGGFTELCRGAWHDVTGRLLEWSWLEGGDLPIPPHQYITDSTIKLGPVGEDILHEWRSKN
jgi:ubiquinol-cytochrome c reductase iron-sulfur subunit